MNAISTEVVVDNDRRINLALALPADYPTGTTQVTLTFTPKGEAANPVNRLAEIRGQGKGKVWMSEDFDAPLHDFADYM